MSDLGRDLEALALARPKASDVVRSLKEAGGQAVLTIDGKSEIVIRDDGSFQKLLELAERAEYYETLRESVAQMGAGEGRPAEEMLDEMRRILAESRSR